MFEKLPTPLAGCWRLKLPRFEDERGDFTKLCHHPFFEELGLETDFPESYFSTSRQGVVRGLHFQTPPHDHAKLVTCLSGRARDVVVDLRRGSPSYGQVAVFELAGGDGCAIYIPCGMAHGFAAHGDDTRLLYFVGTVHAPSHDGGVRWDSVGVDWGVQQPIVSARDQAFPTLAEFASPFEYVA